MTTPQLPSKRSSTFRKLYGQLPEQAQREADRAYQHFKANPDHPGLHFKRIVGIYYSARVGGSYRALAMQLENHWLWFWIGTHAKYDQLLGQLRRSPN